MLQGRLTAACSELRELDRHGASAVLAGLILDRFCHSYTLHSSLSACLLCMLAQRTLTLYLVKSAGTLGLKGMSLCSRHSSQ